MKANLLDFVFVFLVGVLLGVRSRAHELRGGADVKFDGPAAPAPRRLRKGGKNKCQRTRAFTQENQKIGHFCAKRCLKCAGIADAGDRGKCTAEFCRSDNPFALNPNNPDDRIQAGCGRDNLSSKRRSFCRKTCRWCGKEKGCSRKLTEQQCVAAKNEAKTRCAKIDCPSNTASLVEMTSPSPRIAEEPDDEEDADLEEDEEFFSAMYLHLGGPGSMSL